MRKGVFLAAALALLAGGARPAPAADERWVVVYSEKPAVTEFRDYCLVVLDSLHHPPIRPLLEQKKTVIGYIGLGAHCDRRQIHGAAGRALGQGDQVRSREDRGTLAYTFYFLTTNIVLTFTSLDHGFAYYGYGYFASALQSFLIGALVTFRELGRIPYHTFITQPPTARAAPEDEKPEGETRAESAR